MRLSEAMRLGAMYGPQLKHVLTREDGSNCALGAVVFAVYGVEGWNKSFGNAWQKVINLYPQLHQNTTNPVTGLVNHLSFTIVDLNNERNWTREQIADWIEQTFEQPAPAVAEPAREEVCA